MVPAQYYLKKFLLRCKKIEYYTIASETYIFYIYFS